MKKTSQIITEKVFFDVDDITDDVTARRQSVPSIFMFKWNWHILRDTGCNFLLIITKLGPHM